MASGEGPNSFFLTFASDKIGLQHYVVVPTDRLSAALREEHEFDPRDVQDVSNGGSGDGLADYAVACGTNTVHNPLVNLTVLVGSGNGACDEGESASCLSCPSLQVRRGASSPILAGRKGRGQFRRVGMEGNQTPPSALC